MSTPLDLKEKRKFICWLENHGYEVVRKKGSHTIYENQNTQHSVSIPRLLNKMVMKRLKREVKETYNKH